MRNSPTLRTLFLLTLVARVSFLPLALPGTAASPSPLQTDDVPINQIQGNGSRSPVSGQFIKTSGVVTGVTGNGFFLQVPDPEADQDPTTSEGILVLGSSTASLSTGLLARVTGTVVEFVPASDPSSPPQTRIVSTSIEILSSSANPMPSPIVLTITDTNSFGSIEQLERYEGMRVRINSLTAISPTQGIVDEVSASVVSSGVFFGVITGLPRPFREQGVEVPNPLPNGSPCCVPRFDANPERLRIDTGGLTNSTKLDVTSGTVVTNITGPLDYASRTYTILAEPGAVATAAGLTNALPVPPQEDDELAVASINLGRFYDTTDDPQTNDVVITSEGFNRRLNKLSIAIREVLNSPDIIGIQGVENAQTLATIASRVNFDAAVSGAPNPDYQPVLFEGNDPGGLDVGILFKFPGVSPLSLSQLGKDATFTDPIGSSELLFESPPLLIRANIQTPGGGGLTVSFMVNDLQPLSGIADPVEGPRIRARRRAQAEFLANEIQSHQSADPNVNIVLVGGHDSFQFNDGYVDLMGTIKGSPAAPSNVVLASGDLINLDLTNLTDLASVETRYTTVDNGNAQALDHILVNGNMLVRLNSIHFARNNADFPETFGNDRDRPERISEHDIPVAYFKLLPSDTDLSITKVASPETVPPNSQITYTITVVNNGPSTPPEVLVQDFLAFGTRFFSVMASQGTCTPSTAGVGPVRCQLGQLGPGARATVTIVTDAALVPQFPLLITNIASASALIDGQIETVMADASTTLLPGPAIFSASVQKKKLIINGINFQQGAVIELDGVGQKTKNDSELPNLKLIAKKSGKKIKRGERAVLTVLNPDGGRSAPFTFIRPDVP